MVARALVQFLLVSQVLAVGVSGASSWPSGSGSVKPSLPGSNGPSGVPSQPGSVSTTTKKTGLSLPSSPGSIKPTSSPSSIQLSKPTTVSVPSSSPSTPPPSIQTSKSSSSSQWSSTPSKSPSAKPSNFPSSPGSSSFQTPSLEPSISPSVVPSKPVSSPSKVSSTSSQPSRPASGSFSSSVGSSKPSSIGSSATPSKPVSGSPSKAPSSISSVPASGSKSPSSIPSKPMSSVSSSPISKPNTGSSGVSPSQSKPSGPSGRVPKPVSSGSKSLSGSKVSSNPSVPVSKPPGSSSPSGSKPNSSSSKFSSSVKLSVSGTVPVTKPTTGSSIPSGSGKASGSSTPVGSGGSGKPSGGSSASKSNTGASGSVSGPSTSKPSGTGSQSPSEGLGASGSASNTKSLGNSGPGYQSSNTKATGSFASGPNKGSTGVGSITKTNGSGSSSPTGSKPQNSNAGQSSRSGSGGQVGSGGSGSIKPTGSSIVGPVGGSSSSASNAQGGNGGSACSPTCPSSCPTTALSPTATLGCGVITGTTTSLYAATATVNKFLGVPFAQSPPRRFSPPQKGASCDVDATAFKPACIQQFVYPKIVQDFTKAIFNNPGGAPPAESEDCLYLNVYAPSSPAPPGGRAVMFWIYGGALQFGTAGIPFYDGSYFAAYEDVIIVTSNYRTNVFGFATSPEIPVSERNLGYLDQRAALDWVQQNIAAFGGSPDKVTIFGESAGGGSVDALLTSFPANSTPPFRGAILESGQISYNPQEMASTVPKWNQLAQILGCPGTYSSNLACLRAANASAIKNAIEVNILEFNPVADGATLVSNPMQQRLSGNIAKIPVLEGTNAQEGRVFAVGQTNTTAYLQSLGLNDTAAIQALEAAYPLNSRGIGSSDYDQSGQIFTELVFQCPSAFHVNATASIGIPAWRYYYNASFPNSEPYPGLGVYHASEIPLVFSTYPRSNVTVQQYALSRTMRSIWASFAKNPAAGPGWNPVGSGTEASVLIGADSFGEGGIFIGENGTVAKGGYDLGVLGVRGDALGSGVTVIDQSEVDYRCGIFASTYQKNARIGG